LCLVAPPLCLAAMFAHVVTSEVVVAAPLHSRLGRPGSAAFKPRSRNLWTGQSRLVKERESHSASLEIECPGRGRGIESPSDRSGWPSVRSRSGWRVAELLAPTRRGEVDVKTSPHAEGNLSNSIGLAVWQRDGNGTCTVRHGRPSWVGVAQLPQTEEFSMASRSAKRIVGVIGGVVVSAAALLGTTATAEAATPSALSTASTATSATIQPAFPRCQGRKHWRGRWHDNHGWHNAGCW
jgi:hypothetical protein